MKKLWNKWTEIALVKRILVGLVLGAILGLTIPGATGISILGDVFVSALKAIAPLLVFFLETPTAVLSRQLSYFTCSVPYLPLSSLYLPAWHSR